VDALVTRFGATVEELGSAVADDAAGRVAAAATWLARAGVTASGPLLRQGDLTTARDLHAAAARRLDAVRHAGDATGGHRSRPERRLAALIGGRVPLLAPFSLVPADGGDVVDLDPGVAGPEAVGEWLDAVARVRPEVSRLITAGMLSELLTADGGLRACAGQWPLLPGESWAATAAPPQRTSGRLSVVAVTGPSGPPVAGSRVCGLVVDAWAERIPREEQVTGLAVHFDSPGNRPPQSMLLAVTPDGEPWSLNLVLDTLLETLEWATLRAVAPEDLLDYGRAVPTVFVPGDLRPWPQEVTT
jgi:hypothetical protein